MVKNPPTKIGDTGKIYESGRSPGEGNGNPPQYSCWKSHGQRSLVGYSPWARRVRHNLVTKPPPPSQIIETFKRLYINKKKNTTTIKGPDHKWPQNSPTYQWS